MDQNILIEDMISYWIYLNFLGAKPLPLAVYQFEQKRLFGANGNVC